MSSEKFISLYLPNPLSQSLCKATSDSNFVSRILPFPLEGSGHINIDFWS